MTIVAFTGQSLDNYLKLLKPLLAKENSYNPFRQFILCFEVPHTIKKKKERKRWKAQLLTENSYNKCPNLFSGLIPA